MQIPAGLMLDRLGARKLLTLMVFISACGVIIFGLTHHFALAGVARFLIGFGSAFSFISALFLVSRWFSHKHFAFIAGLIQLGGCLGSIFGLEPLALAINHFGWRESMVVIGIVTFAFSIIFWLVIRDGKADKHDPLTVEIKSEWQRLKIALRNTQVWWVSLCGFLSWIPVATIGALWGTIYLMKVYGINNAHAGKICSLFWMGLGFGSPFIGWFSNFVQKRITPLLICFAVGLLAASILIEAVSFPMWIMGIAFFLLGLSASVQSYSFCLIKEAVPVNVFCTASGINNMAAILGGAIAQVLVGFILNWCWTGNKVNGLPFYTIHDYQIAFLILPFAAMAGLFVAYFKIKEPSSRLELATQQE